MKFLYYTYELYTYATPVYYVHEILVTTSGTITVTDLFLSMAQGRTYITNVLVSIYVPQTFRFNMIQ